MQTNIVFHCDKCKLDDYDDSKHYVTKINELEDIVESNYMVTIIHNRCDNCKKLIVDNWKSEAIRIYVYGKTISVCNANHATKIGVYYYDRIIVKLNFENDKISENKMTFEELLNDVKDGSIICTRNYDIPDEIKNKLGQKYKLELIRDKFNLYYQLVKWPTTKHAIKKIN